MNWRTLLLLAVAIVLIASGIAIHILVKPVQKMPFKVTVFYGKITETNVEVGNQTFFIAAIIPNASYFTLNAQPLSHQPLYARLWFVLLVVGIIILGFLGFKRFKL